MRDLPSNGEFSSNNGDISIYIYICILHISIRRAIFFVLYLKKHPFSGVGKEGRKDGRTDGRTDGRKEARKQGSKEARKQGRKEEGRKKGRKEVRSLTLQ
jgi:hypothetical protein